MGRFDLLTSLDTQSPPLPQKEEILSPAPQPESSTVSPLPTNMQTGLHAKKQTRKQVNFQTSKPVSKQTSKEVNPQAGLHANLQTGNPTLIVKYSTYLTPACKKGLKRIAFETDRKDYEVLIEAVEQYLKKQQ